MSIPNRNYSFGHRSTESLRFVLFLISFLIGVQSFGQATAVEELEQRISQGKGDTTEVNDRNQMFRLLFRSDIKTAKKHLDEAFRLAKKIEFKKGIALCYKRYSIYYTSIGNYDRSLKMLKKARPLFEEMDNLVGINSCINGEANIHISQGRYDQALELYMETEQISEKANLPREVAAAKHNISLVYYTLQKFDEALDYLNQSLEINKSMSDSSGMLVSYNGISAVLSAQNKHSEALAIQQDALQLAQRLKNFAESASLLNNMGAQYYYLNQPDSSRSCYLKSLSLYKKLNAKMRVAEAYSNLGNLESSLENGVLSRAYYDSCLAVAQEIKTLPTVSIAYQGLSKSNEILGNYEEALNWYTKYHDLNDSLVGERVKLNINELQEKYESGKKDLQIAELAKAETEALAVADKRKYFLMLIGILASAAITFLILYISRKKAKEKLRIGQLEQKALRSQMNPHFIFNSLNSIQRLYIEGKEDLANDYMADFSSLLRQILENSSMDKVNLKEELRSTMLYLDLEKMRTDGSFAYQFNIDSNIDQLNTMVPPLILQPYVENAIWHGILPGKKQGTITVDIKRVDNDIECVITDDGIGINKSMNQKISTTRKSKGMSITADRLGGEGNVVVSELETGGTEVKLRIRKTK